MIYGVHLTNKIELETRGNFKDFLLALAARGDYWDPSICPFESLLRVPNKCIIRFVCTLLSLSHPLYLVIWSLWLCMEDAVCLYVSYHYYHLWVIIYSEFYQFLWHVCGCPIFLVKGGWLDVGDWKRVHGQFSEENISPPFPYKTEITPMYIPYSKSFTSLSALTWLEWNKSCP